MTLNLSTAIREINQEKGISEELIQETIESALTHAYKKYYGTLLETMNSNQEEFYIKGIYFRENTDINKFLDFYKWLKAVNRKTKAFNNDALNYAMFEILAEYKRKGITKTKLIKAMLSFGIPYLAVEIPERKKRARTDGHRCIESAEKIGLKKTGGTLEFPTFSK